MCDSSIGSLDEALIQLQYALGDYYSCGKRAAEFGPLHARLRVLREACVAAQFEISLFAPGSGPMGFAPLAPLVDQPNPRHVAHR